MYIDDNLLINKICFNEFDSVHKMVTEISVYFHQFFIHKNIFFASDQHDYFRIFINEIKKYCIYFNSCIE